MSKAGGGREAAPAKPRISWRMSMLSGKWVDYVKRNSKITALGSAAIIVVVGLGALSLPPQSHTSAQAPEPVRMVSAQQVDLHASPPRMLESGAPVSLAALVVAVT